MRALRQWILFTKTARQLHSGNGRHTAKRSDVCADSNGGQLQMFVSSQRALYVQAAAAVPLQAWSGPEGSRKLRFPNFMTTAQEAGKVVSLMHRPHLPTGNSPGTHFC